MPTSCHRKVKGGTGTEPPVPPFPGAMKGVFRQTSPVRHGQVHGPAPASTHFTLLPKNVPFATSAKSMSPFTVFPPASNVPW